MVLKKQKVILKSNKPPLLDIWCHEIQKTNESSAPKQTHNKLQLILQYHILLTKYNRIFTERNWQNTASSQCKAESGYHSD